jgi:hypothetical protein
MSKVVYVMLDHVDANFNIPASKATKFCIIETYERKEKMPSTQAMDQQLGEKLERWRIG